MTYPLTNEGVHGNSLFEIIWKCISHVLEMVRVHTREECLIWKSVCTDESLTLKGVICIAMFVSPKGTQKQRSVIELDP